MYPLMRKKRYEPSRGRALFSFWCNYPNSVLILAQSFLFVFLNRYCLVFLDNHNCYVADVVLYHPTLWNICLNLNNCDKLVRSVTEIHIKCAFYYFPEAYDLISEVYEL